MAFYWRGNQLFTKQGPTGDDDLVWTTFVMDIKDMREPAKVYLIHIPYKMYIHIYLANISFAIFLFSFFFFLL